MFGLYMIMIEKSSVFIQKVRSSNSRFDFFERFSPEGALRVSKKPKALVSKTQEPYASHKKQSNRF